MPITVATPPQSSSSLSRCRCCRRHRHCHCRCRCRCRRCGRRCGRRCVGHLHYHRRRHRECASAVVTTHGTVSSNQPMYRGHVDLPCMAAISSPLALPRAAPGRRLRSCRPFWGPVVCPSRLAPRTRKLECTESTCSLSRGGVSFGAKEGLSKKRLIRAAGANQSQGGRLHAI